MQLNVVRVAETVRLDTGICRLDLMVEPALEDRDATEHEILLCRTRHGAGIINVKDMHRTTVLKKRPSGEAFPGEPCRRGSPGR